jgi:hypothetical protein
MLIETLEFEQWLTLIPSDVVILFLIFTGTLLERLLISLQGDETSEAMTSK